LPRFGLLLNRLKTDRIDIYWVHYPDGVTPAEEIVRGFEDPSAPARKPVPWASDERARRAVA